ncbi:hypothetical protein C8R45DRAFT_939560 [Mycena sanguinolenta]|nr:hypothetical protein C8R45DRAFT_939560 [Mycena sanguinolenta]
METPVIREISSPTTPCVIRMQFRSRRHRCGPPGIHCLGRVDNQYGHWGGEVDLRQVLLAHGSYLRSLSVDGVLKDPHVLSCCANLQRFQPNYLSEELMAAIPRTINTLSMPFFPVDPQFYFSLPTPHISVAPLTQQLDEFPMLRVLVLGSPKRQFDALRKRCIELCYRRNFGDAPTALIHNEVQFELRRKI